MSKQAFQPQQSLSWLFFDLNSYFASVEQQDNPALIDKPVAVVPSMTDSTCAIAASYEAKAYGVKTGTKIYDAKKLCPDIKCVPARHDLYVDYHHRIWNEVEKHIPIEQTCSIDEAACRLLRNEQDRAVEIARNIKQSLKENIGPAITCSIGIAQNKFLAKTATDMQKPDGLVVLRPNDYKDRLFGLELSDLCGIGRNIERRLNRARITTIEHLWNTQPKHVRQIWGSVEGEIFWYRLRGYEIPEKPTQKRVVGHSRVLDPKHRNSDAAYDITKLLATKACARLRRYGLYARKFNLSVRLLDGDRSRRLVWSQDTSFAATHDNTPILIRLEHLWRAMQQHTRKARLLKVSVTLHNLVEPECMTLDLFDYADAQRISNKDHMLSTTIDTLNKRFGAQTVNIGVPPKTAAGFVGTKIAFSRVPEREEFCE